MDHLLQIESVESLQGAGVAPGLKESIAKEIELRSVGRAAVVDAGLAEIPGQVSRADA
jgi:hypothetical protein